MVLPEWTTGATWLLGLAMGIAANRRKSAAETDDIAVTTLRGVIAELRAEIDYKDKELKQLRARLDALEVITETIGDLPPSHLA